METARNLRRALAWAIIAMLVIPFGTPVRQAWAQEDEYRFSKEELVQMLAPIALYPDSLIAQMLMASTYPLEVVEAERWRNDNKELQGDALYDALREKPWDPSVKALCNFPDVLFAMSDKLDQTRKLGDAFLTQEQEVMETIQELRRKALEQGSLRTTGEQKVIVEREVVRIEPASPQVVYVPVYDPYYVYGPWWYPAYPPYYWYYPPRPFVSGIHFGFGPRVFIGAGLFSWVWFDWHVHRVHIDVVKTFRFHRHHARPSHDRFYWRHDPRHRRGIAYRDRRTSERFGVPSPLQRSPRPETRGFSPDTGERRGPVPGTTSGSGRGRAATPESRREEQRDRSSGPGSGRGRITVPETRRESQGIDSAPLRVTPPSTSGPGRERTTVPESRREEQRDRSSGPGSGREQRLAPETRSEPPRPQPAPLRVAPPSTPGPGRDQRPVPDSRREGPRVQPAPRQDTPFRGFNDGSFERRSGERGGESRRGREILRRDERRDRQEERRDRQDDDSRGRGGGSRR